jgi:hypothetical protein
MINILFEKLNCLIVKDFWMVKIWLYFHKSIWIAIFICFKISLSLVTIQLNPMVQSHGLHKVVLPKKGTEYSSIGVFNVLPFLLWITIDNQFYSNFCLNKNLYKKSLIVVKSLFDVHIWCYLIKLKLKTLLSSKTLFSNLNFESKTLQ